MWAKYKPKGGKGKEGFGGAGYSGPFGDSVLEMRPWRCNPFVGGFSNHRSAPTNVNRPENPRFGVWGGLEAERNHLLSEIQEPLGKIRILGLGGSGDQFLS